VVLSGAHQAEVVQGHDDRSVDERTERQHGMDQPVVPVNDVRALVVQEAPERRDELRIRERRRRPSVPVEEQPIKALDRPLDAMDPKPVDDVGLVETGLQERHDNDIVAPPEELTAELQDVAFLSADDRREPLGDEHHLHRTPRPEPADRRARADRAACRDRAFARARA
jgi:hypothetical protein